MSTIKKPVLSYSEFIAEKINQNLSDIKTKGSKPGKEVDPSMAELPSGSGKKLNKEVNPDLKEIPKAGKASSATVKSNLSNLKKGSKGKASTAEVDPKFAKTPGK